MAATDAQPYFDPAPVVTAVADNAVTGKRIAKVSAARPASTVLPGGGLVNITHATDGSAPLLGVVIRDAAADATTELALEGVWPIKAGETIAAGDPITAGAAGVAMVAAAGEYAIGVAWDDAAQDADVPVRLAPFTVPA